MSYTKTVWVDGTNAFTPTSEDDPKLNAENLNKIEQGIYDNAVDIAELEEYRQSGVVSATVKNAIIGLFEKCAYIDTDESIASNLAILESWAAEVTSITLSESTLTFSGSGSQTLTATVDPVGSTVTWTSSDTSVATVSDGVVTSVGNGSCTITAAAGNLSATCSVTVSGMTASHTITNSLTRVTSDNSATTATDNSAYTANITADGSYTLAYVTVTMGGVDVTSTVYDNAGAISIAAVTGDVVITAEADLHYWDFTTSTDDVISGSSPTITGTTRDSDGIHCSALTDNINLGSVLTGGGYGQTFEIKFGDIVADTSVFNPSNVNVYLFYVKGSSNFSNSFGWANSHSSLGCSVYKYSKNGSTVITPSGASWLTFAHNNADYASINNFSNKLVKVVISSNGIWSLYADDTEIVPYYNFESVNAYIASRGTSYNILGFGGGSATFADMTIKSVKIY